MDEVDVIEYGKDDDSEEIDEIKTDELIDVDELKWLKKEARAQFFKELFTCPIYVVRTTTSDKYYFITSHICLLGYTDGVPDVSWYTLCGQIKTRVDKILNAVSLGDSVDSFVDFIDEEADNHNLQITLNEHYHVDGIDKSFSYELGGERLYELVKLTVVHFDGHPDFYNFNDVIELYVKYWLMEYNRIESSGKTTKLYYSEDDLGYVGNGIWEIVKGHYATYTSNIAVLCPNRFVLDVDLTDLVFNDGYYVIHEVRPELGLQWVPNAVGLVALFIGAYLTFYGLIPNSNPLSNSLIHSFPVVESWKTRGLIYAGLGTNASMSVGMKIFGKIRVVPIFQGALFGMDTQFPIVPVEGPKVQDVINRIAGGTVLQGYPDINICSYDLVTKKEYEKLGHRVNIGNL